MSDIFKSFVLQENSQEAAEKYFESKRKKRFLFNKGEKIGGIQKRYAPVGRFRVVQNTSKKRGMVSKNKHVIRKENSIYFDLAHYELFYLKKNFIGKPCELMHSDLPSVIHDLSEGESSLLMDLVEFGSVEYAQLCNPIDEQNMIRLLQKGLIEVYSAGADKVFKIAEIATKDYYLPEKSYVRAKLFIPKIADNSYKLDAFIETGEVSLENIVADEATVSTDNAAELIEDLFLGEAFLEDVFYLPYYLCIYEDEKEEANSRVLFYFPLKFI